MKRSGVIAKKLGMTQVYAEDGAHIPVTVLSLEGCQVVAHKTLERDGYSALQLGAGEAKPSRVSKAERERFAKASVTPKRRVREFRIDADALIEIGAVITADHFVPGQKVDVVGTSVGKGFAGAMKRHNFGGLRATHGVSISHRSHGSTGQCQDPGKVFKGKKMAGHMGAVRRTQQNLEVVRAEIEEGLILIKGAVPGSKGGWVEIRDAVKGIKVDEVPMPGKFQAGPAVKAAPKAEAKPKPEPKAEVKPEPKVEAKPEPKVEAKPAAKVEAKPEPKVLYTDGATDGEPDDLKKIKGIGPKFEKDLNGKGIYYWRQIAAWKAADVEMVEGIIDSFPGRITRDEWVKQAASLAAGGAPEPMKSNPKGGK